MLRAIFSSLLQGIPSQCAVCHAWPARGVCDACVTEFAQPVTRCPRCALPAASPTAGCAACADSMLPLDQAIAAVDYAYPWSRLIVEFKFLEHPEWARCFAQIMRSAPWVEPALDAADMLVAMPLAPARLRTRGFNQSLLLARALDARKVRPDVLIRTRNTPPQSSLPRKERLRSVQGAFAVPAQHAQALRGKRVVLVDDVMTSGASMHAAASTLRAAGVAHITGMVFARTP